MLFISFLVTKSDFEAKKAESWLRKRNINRLLQFLGYELGFRNQENWLLVSKTKLEAGKPNTAFVF